MKKITLFLTLLLGALLSGCGPQDEGTTKHNANSNNTNQIIEVVINENAFPFSFIDDNDQYSGYDGELLTIIAEKLSSNSDNKYQFHFNAVSRDAMMIGLSTGTYTLGANHFYLTEERAEKYLSTNEPIGLSDLRLIVRNDETDINSLSDLANTHKTLVPVHINDARYLVIENYNIANPNNQIKLQAAGEQTAADMFKAVASKEYDAAIYPMGGYIAVMKKLPLDLKVSSSVGLFPNVFLFNKNADPELIQQIDQILIELKNNGTLSALSEKWLGEDVYQLEGAKNIKVPQFSKNN